MTMWEGAAQLVSAVRYETQVKPDPAALRAFYARQGHVTTEDIAKLDRMLESTFFFVTAYLDDQIIGLARGITDGVTGRFVECKLDPGYQGPGCVTRRDGRIEHDAAGIAGEMARLVINAMVAYGVERIDAVAYGTEVDFCLDLGFRRMPGVVALELIPRSEAASGDRDRPAST